MENGALPWEASRAALDLLRWRLDQEYERPSVNLVLWYWRATLAYPGLTIAEGNVLAVLLLLGEVTRRHGLPPYPPDPEGLEWQLAYRTFHSTPAVEDVDAVRTLDRRERASGARTVKQLPQALTGPNQAAMISISHPMSALFILELYGAEHLKNARTFFSAFVASMERELEEDPALSPEDGAGGMPGGTP